MRIFYVTNARLPTEKAHGLATVKLCEAFARQGAEVTAVAPWRWNPLREDPFTYYRVERNFNIVRMPSIDLLWLGFGERFFFLVQLFSFSAAASLWLLIRYGLWGSLRDVVVFSHDHIPLFFVSFFAPKIFYDAHHYPERTLLYTRVLREAIGIAVQTKWKVAALQRDFGIPAAKIIYWPNGTDIERFDIPFTRAEARERLGLPQDKKIVLYTGSLLPWKGVDTLVDAATLLPPGVMTYIVGGSNGEISKFPARLRLGEVQAGGQIINYKSQTNHKSQIVFAGQKPWKEIPLWLKAADVLVLPNTGREKVSRFYTSPMKLFEYMASGRSIVASDVPSIREIVDESMAFFAVPDDPNSLAAAIRQILIRPEEGARRAERAQRASRTYTWDARAGTILAKCSAVAAP